MANAKVKSSELPLMLSFVSCVNRSSIHLLSQMKPDFSACARESKLDDKKKPSLRIAQENDGYCHKILTQLRRGKKKTSFVISDDILFHQNSRTKRYAAVMPEVFLDEVWKEYHDDPTGGHFGLKATFAKISHHSPRCVKSLKKKYALVKSVKRTNQKL